MNVNAIQINASQNSKPRTSNLNKLQNAFIPLELAVVYSVP